jgi:ATP-dependent Clp protease ATP-binding subunit ClpB
MLEVDENVTPFILKKLNVNVPLFIQILNSTIQSFPKVTGGEVMLSRTANSTLNEAESIAKKMMNDSFLNIWYSLFLTLKVKGHIKRSRVTEKD